MRRAIQKQLTDLEVEHKAIFDSTNAERQCLEQLIKERKEITSSIDIYKKEAITANEELLTLQSKVDAKKTELEGIEKTLQELNEQKNNVLTTIKNKEEESEVRLKRCNEELDKIILQGEKKIDYLKREVEQEEKKKEIIHTDREKIKEEIVFLNTNVALQEKRVEELQKIITQKEGEIEKLKKEVITLEETIKNEKEALQVIRDSTKDIGQDTKKKEIEITILNEEINNLIIKKENLEKEVYENQERMLNITRKENRLNEMSDKIKELYEKAGIKITLYG